MGNLTTTAVLRYSDQMSAGLQATAGRVHGINQKLASSARNAATATAATARSTAMRTAAVGYGVARLVERAQEANTNLFDIGVSSLFNTGSVKQAQERMRSMSGTALSVAKDVGTSINDVTGDVARLMNAGVSDDLLVGVAKDMSLLRLTDADLPSEAVAGYGQTLINLAQSFDQLKNASGGAITQQQFLNQEFERAAIIAKGTAWKTGDFIDARAKTTGILSASKMKQTDQDILMGMYARQNINPDVAATTVRSMTQHMIAPVGNDIKGWNIAADYGINRGDYMQGTLDRGTFGKQLRACGDGQLSAKEIKRLTDRAMSMQANGTLGDADALGNLAQHYASAAGLRFDTEEERAAVSERLQTALSGGGLAFDQIKLLKDAAAKMPQEAYLNFLRMINEDKRFSELARMGTGFLPDADGKTAFDKMSADADSKSGALGKVAELNKTSPEARANLIKSNLDNISLRLTQGEGMKTLTDSLLTLVTASDDLIAKNPQLANYGLALAGLVVAAPAIGLLGRGIGLVARGTWALGRGAVGLGRGVAAVRAGAGIADLAFGMDPQKSIAKRAAAAQSANMISRMGVNAQQSGRMISGMSGAMQTAAGDMAALTSGAKLLRLGLLGVGAAAIFEGVSALDKVVNPDGHTKLAIGGGKSARAAAPDQDFAPAGGLKPLSLLPTFGPEDPRMFGPPAPLDLSQTTIAVPSWLEGLGAMITAAVERATLNVNVNASPSGTVAARGRGAASAPAPRVSNGQQYNGGN
jgi:hypothetical protein